MISKPELDLGIWTLVFGSWYLDLGIWTLVFGTWYLELVSLKLPFFFPQNNLLVHRPNMNIALRERDFDVVFFKNFENAEEYFAFNAAPVNII